MGRQSFEYKNTVRTFDFEEKERDLLDQIREISMKCWNVFGLRGYARVDFRVSEEGHPFVLELNANPCIAEDSGFMAACRHAGLDNSEVIKRIISNLN